MGWLGYRFYDEPCDNLDMAEAKHRMLIILHEGATKHSQASVVWAEPSQKQPESTKMANLQPL
jgi:hypothetical protein